jgi:hypothetical protein
MRFRSAPALVACWLCVSLSGAAGQAMPADSDDHALRVTTDTREYCDHLLARIERARETKETPHLSAEMLRVEGEHMCAHGQVRRGIARLRRALVLLQTKP